MILRVLSLVTELWMFGACATYGPLATNPSAYAHLHIPTSSSADHIIFNSCTQGGREPKRHSWQKLSGLVHNQLLLK